MVNSNCITSVYITCFTQELPLCACSGIGLAVADRLLSVDSGITVCLGCRNEARAKAARGQLLEQHPTSRVDILLVDVSKLASVHAAAQELRTR